ncbi:S41 family peptidase [Metamycoplasma auris]|uniref:Peptidase S41-like protein n=1 Tax=Metamycoplasma auris TaxID=51363 RepID=A0A2W7G127_9BACT|nr:S41 family peptidase [Metamycoplasma auris]PZV98714.1 peptidase S41-like protein [Metamycoplasma auris]
MKTKNLNFLFYITPLSLAPLSVLSIKCQSSLNPIIKPFIPPFSPTNPLIPWIPPNNASSKNINDDSLSLKVTKHSFKNFNPEYYINDRDDLSVYRIQNMEETAYIDLDEFLDALNGFIDPDSISEKILDEDHGKKTYKVDNGAHLIIDWKNNQIKLNSNNFFHSIISPQRQTNAGKFLRVNYDNVRSHKKLTDDPYLIFDLNKYNMDILYYKKKVLVPFSVFNALFVSQNFNNIYFNGENFTSLYAGLDISFGHRLSLEAKKRIKNIKKNKPTKKERQVNFNHLMFVMDNFYGLKEYKEIKSFEDWIGSKYKQKLLSTDPKEFHQAYVDIFHKKLNELHTNINSFSYYDKFKIDPITVDLFAKNPKKYFGDYFNKFVETKANLDKYFNQYVTNMEITDWELKDYIRFHNQTAIISIFNFIDSTQEQGSRRDAWKYDTYYLIKELMELVERRNKLFRRNGHQEIKNIVLDLSRNGGGSVLAMIRTLGFLTNQKITAHDYNALDKISIDSHYSVDVFANNQFHWHNYDKYNWNLLIGMNTFSAANQAASIVKDMRIAKVIGQRSGGGMCSIMPIVLDDGTTITISSPNLSINKNGLETESGIEPDIPLDYKDFYNDEIIDDILNNKYN